MDESGDQACMYMSSLSMPHPQYSYLTLASIVQAGFAKIEGATLSTMVPSVAAWPTNLVSTGL